MKVRITIQGKKSGTQKEKDKLRDAIITLELYIKELKKLWKEWEVKE